MWGHLARRMCRLDGRFSDPVIPGSPPQYGKALYQHMCDPPQLSPVSKVSRDKSEETLQGSHDYQALLCVYVINKCPERQNQQCVSQH